MTETEIEVIKKKYKEQGYTLHTLGSAIGLGGQNNQPRMSEILKSIDQHPFHRKKILEVLGIKEYDNTGSTSIANDTPPTYNAEKLDPIEQVQRYIDARRGLWELRKDEIIDDETYKRKSAKLDNE